MPQIPISRRGVVWYAFNVGGALLWVLGLCSAGYFFGNLPWVKLHLDKIIWALVFIPGLIALLGAWRGARRSVGAPSA